MAATDYDFIQSRNEIIQSAFEKIGAISPGQVLNGEMIAQGARVLNDVVKHWQTKKLFAWTLKALTTNLTAGNKSYSLSTDPAVVGIDSAYLRISSQDTPLEVISWRSYNAIVDKDADGDPTVVTCDPQGAPTLYVWPVPTQSRTLFYLGITKLKDWESASTSADIPVRFQRALTYALAWDLADHYSLPSGEVGKLERKYKEAFGEALSTERDRSDYEFVEGAFSSGR